jgi:hypothetical protein
LWKEGIKRFFWQSLQMICSDRFLQVIHNIKIIIS